MVSAVVSCAYQPLQTIKNMNEKNDWSN